MVRGTGSIGPLAGVDRCCGTLRRALAAGIFVMAVCGTSASASAAELLIQDVVIDLDEASHGFYFFPPPANGPSDWTSPDDYYQGTFELRFEVLSQPSQRTSNLQMCIWLTDGNETCPPHVPVDGPGDVATASTSPSTWWTMSGPVDFAHPELWDHMGMPLWNEDPCLVTDWTTGCWDDRGDYLPMQVRLTAVAVSAGATFSGWDAYVPPLGAPTVLVTAPSDGAEVAEGSTVTFTATAEDADGTVALIELFDGTSEIGSSSSSPVSVAWVATGAGVHTLRARATDDDGLTGEDDVQVIVVGTGGSGGSGGTPATGGAEAGGASAGGEGVGLTPPGEDDDGCSCGLAGRPSKAPSPWVVALLGLLGPWRRGRRNR